MGRRPSSAPPSLRPAEHVGRSDRSGDDASSLLQTVSSSMSVLRSADDSAIDIIVGAHAEQPLSLREVLPEVLSCRARSLQSIGSLAHSSGQCSKCVFENKKQYKGTPP